MNFDIRSVSLCHAGTAPVEVSAIAGKELVFTSGIPLKFVLPEAPECFEPFVGEERALAVLSDWARVFKMQDRVIVLGVLEKQGPLFEFAKLSFDFTSARKNSPTVLTPVSAEILTFDECVDFLVDLYLEYSADRHRNRWVILRRPAPLPKPSRVRMAWVGPSILGDADMSARLGAIAVVFGATLHHVVPTNFTDVRKKLAMLQLDAVILSKKYAPYLSPECAPDHIDRSLVLECHSATVAALESQICTWIQIAEEELERIEADHQADDAAVALATMIKGMLAHAKIGQFKHCSRDQVFTAIRAQGLSTSVAEQQLDANCEQFSDKRESEKLFLKKGHNDGDQYFLNPKMVTIAKQLAELVRK